MANNVIPLLVVALVPLVLGAVSQRAPAKRSAALDSGDFDYSDYNVKEEEYPIVVPKRAALLLDRLMVALQKAVDNQERENVGGSRSFVRSYSLPNPPTAGNSKAIVPAGEQTMDLQRRGQAKGRIYWRCYFNAVTCFKRK